jgi:GIY-YIG catalytic domain
MPKTAIDHSNTIIYKLVKNDDYDNVNIYIGSTTDFIRRKNKHKSCCNCVTNKAYNDKKYQYIRDNGGWDCFNMIEVEKYNCNDGNEAKAREEYWRCHFNAQLNTIRAYITDIERLERDKLYRGDNKDKISESKKQYYEAHKDNILKQRKEYYETHLEQRKEYYETHKDRLIENMKIYYYNKKNKTDSSSDDSTESIIH